jgi:predicted HTH domain antitoxin
MSVKTRTQVLDDLVEIFTPDDLRWLREQLDRLLDDEPQPESHIWQDDDDDDEPLPESATLDEAVELYLADKCSLGRAAQLAGVMRWDIHRILKERGIPTNGNHDFTPEEYERMLDIMEDLLDDNYQ